MFAAGPPGLGFWIDLDHRQGACDRCCTLAVAITLTCGQLSIGCCMSQHCKGGSDQAGMADDAASRDTTLKLWSISTEAGRVPQGIALKSTRHNENKVLVQG